MFYPYPLPFSRALLHVHHWAVLGEHKVLKREEDRRQAAEEAGLS